MQYSSAILLTALAATNVLAHGVVDSVTGANGVTMPGLSVIDGTPRDCSQNSCGSQADTAIIRTRELGTARASALGRTQGGGPVDPAAMIIQFMGGDVNSTRAKQAREIHTAMMERRQLFGGLRGSGGKATPKGTMETGVAASAGVGESDGLPTTTADGTITMNFHQINQDGAGPLTASIDPSSGGADPDAFQSAEVTKNVPGVGIQGLSLATNMDFPLSVQMPAGMTCSGTVGGATNVCIGKVQNGAAAGPFGGGFAFTQSSAARKRAIEYTLSKRRFARAIAASQD